MVEPASDDRARIRSLLQGMGALCAVALVAGWNRMWPPAFMLRSCGDVLRWREALSMLLLAPLLVVLLWRLYRLASAGRHNRWGVVFLAGAYFLGVGMGMHDVCDLLGRAYPSAPEPLRRSLDFFDTDLGHWVFFAGFVLTSTAAAAAQLERPLQQPMGWVLTAVFGLLSVPLLFVMLTNLMFEKTGPDLVVIAATALLIAALHGKRRVGMRRLPLLCLLYPCYVLAVLGTVLHGLM